MKGAHQVHNPGNIKMRGKKCIGLGCGCCRCENLKKMWTEGMKSRDQDIEEYLNSLVNDEGASPSMTTKNYGL